MAKAPPVVAQNGHSRAFLLKIFGNWHGIVPKNRASFQRRKEGLLKKNNFTGGHFVVANQESPIQIFY